MVARQFEDLLVWRRALILCVEVYRATRRPAWSTDWGLRDQMQRAGVSVISNIAEGFERYSKAEFKRFLRLARGSVAELRSSFTSHVNFTT